MMRELQRKNAQPHAKMLKLNILLFVLMPQVVAALSPIDG
jgi:hypothetical protein